PDRRGDDAGFLPLLGGRCLQARPAAAEFRQATPARLPRRRATRRPLERRRARAAAAGERGRRDEQTLPRSLSPRDGTGVESINSSLRGATATKQSRPCPWTDMDCFAPLAMTTTRGAPPMSEPDAVLVERDGPITIVSINRPHCRNAVDGATARKLYD